MLKKSLLIAATAMVAVSAPAFAHSAWLLPSTTVLSDTKGWITVDAGTSTAPFNADHNPLSTDDIKVWTPDGSAGQIQNPARGRYRSVFDVQIDKAGTWRIGTFSTTVGGTFKVGDETWFVGRRRGGPGGPGGGAGGPGAPVGQPGAGVTRPAQPPREGGAPTGGGEGGPPRPPMNSVATVAEIPANATEVTLTENISRNEFFVTAGAPTNLVFKPTNKGLELVPITHPDELVSNEQGRFRFLVDGKPAVNLTVAVVPGGKRFREAEGAQELTTGADGTVAIAWPVPGFYWINATLTDDRPTDPKASKRRLSYTVTVEVPAP